ncbi:MAG: hypothetical protein ABSG79_12915 [Bryobacteraceae bacterium]|jgi:hypothetical protein
MNEMQLNKRLCDKNQKLPTRTNSMIAIAMNTKNHRAERAAKKDGTRSRWKKWTAAYKMEAAPTYLITVMLP